MDVVEQKDGAIIVYGSKTMALKVFFQNKERLKTLQNYLGSVDNLELARCEYELKVVNLIGESEVVRRKSDCTKSAGEYLGLNNNQTVKF